MLKGQWLLHAIWHKNSSVIAYFTIWPQQSLNYKNINKYKQKYEQTQSYKNITIRQIHDHSCLHIILPIVG